MSGPTNFNGYHSPAPTRDVVWLTPKHVIDALGPFDLDPCAAPSPRPWDTANAYYELPTDGLSSPWFGRVWCNPPYGAETWKWLHRLAEHGTGTALVFARVETVGFHASVWERATGVLFLKGRLSFHRPNGAKGIANAGAPSCLVAYGEGDAERLRTSTLVGQYVDLTNVGATA